MTDTLTGCDLDDITINIDTDIVLIRPKRSIASDESWKYSDYDSAESEPIWMKLDICEPDVGGWPWHILGAIRAVATV